MVVLLYILYLFVDTLIVFVRFSSEFSEHFYDIYIELCLIDCLFPF